nr:VIT1/CCC1 transporter family protein [Homoserinimonas sp. OAct 916]
MADKPRTKTTSGTSEQRGSKLSVAHHPAGHSDQDQASLGTGSVDRGLAGALPMGAGEYVSVQSQRELLEASTADPQMRNALPHLDIDANELALLYRSRGMSPDDAQAHAAEVLNGNSGLEFEAGASEPDQHEAVGTGLGAAMSSFCFFASGAIIPVLPYLFWMEGIAAVIVSAGLVGVALLGTGAIVGLLSGASPVKRGLRQLMIGFGAAAATYLLGLLLGTGAV